MNTNVFEGGPNEKWKKINGYPAYSISSRGRVRNDDTDTILRPDGVLKKRALCIKLRNDDGIKKFTVAKLVANEFIPNQNNSKNVIHKNKNRLDNRVENLRWSQEK